MRENIANPAKNQKISVKLMTVKTPNSIKIPDIIDQPNIGNTVVSAVLGKNNRPTPAKQIQQNKTKKIVVNWLHSPIKSIK